MESEVAAVEILTLRLLRFAVIRHESSLLRLRSISCCEIVDTAEPHVHPSHIM